MPLAVLLFVPVVAVVTTARSASSTATDGWVRLSNNFGRLLLKNYAVAGPALIVLVAVAAAGARALAAALGRDPMLRFAVLGLLVTEVLFLRMPWKPAHLVPCLWPWSCGWRPASATGGRSCGW